MCADICINAVLAAHACSCTSNDKQQDVDTPHTLHDHILQAAQVLGSAAVALHQRLEAVAAAIAGGGGSSAATASWGKNFVVRRMPASAVEAVLAGAAGRHGAGSDTESAVQQHVAMSWSTVDRVRVYVFCMHSEPLTAMVTHSVQQPYQQYWYIPNLSDQAQNPYRPVQTW